MLSSLLLSLLKCVPVSGDRMNVLAAATAAAAANATVSTTDCFLTSSSSFFAKIPRSCLYRPNSFLSIFHPILVAKDAAWLTVTKRTENFTGEIEFVYQNLFIFMWKKKKKKKTTPHQVFKKVILKSFS